MCTTNACRYMHIVNIPLYLSHRAFFPLLRGSVRWPLGGWLGVERVRRSNLSSCGSCLFFVCSCCPLTI